MYNASVACIFRVLAPTQNTSQWYSCPPLRASDPEASTLQSLQCCKYAQSYIYPYLVLSIYNLVEIYNVVNSLDNFVFGHRYATRPSHFTAVKRLVSI